MIIFCAFFCIQNHLSLYILYNIYETYSIEKDIKKTYHFTKAWRVLQGVSDINEGPSLVLLTGPDVGKLDGQVLDVGAEVLDRLQSVREITEQKSS